jgi:hydrogenase maturation protease
VKDEVLVAGIGNIFLADDGFGPEVVRHLARAAEPPLPAQVRLVDYGIRGMHLVYDLLDGYRALLIVDALPGGGEPGAVNIVKVGPEDVENLGGDFDPHAMSPVAVLAGLPALGGRLPPTYVIGAAPQTLDAGIGLSETMTAAVPRAAGAVRQLLAAQPWTSERPASTARSATFGARRGD